VDKAYGKQIDRQATAQNRPRAGASVRRRFGSPLDGELYANACGCYTSVDREVPVTPEEGCTRVDRYA
jgi:hypothetical protein